MGYVFQAYPKWLYASGGRSCIVNSHEEYLKKNANGEWVESPAQLSGPRQAVAPPSAPPAAPPAVVPDLPPAVTAAVEDGEAKLAKFYTMPARLIVEHIYKSESLEDLMDIRRAEEGRPGGARVTVLRAVLARMEAFNPTPAAVEEEEDAKPVNTSIPQIDEIARAIGVD